MSAKGDLELAAVIEPHGGVSLMAIIFALGDLLPNHWTANFDFGGCLTEGDEVVKRAVSLANARSASTDDIKFFAENCRLGPDNEFWSYEDIPIAIESFNFEPWQVLTLRSEKYRVRERLSRYWNLHWLEEGRYRLRPKRDPASELRFELMFYKLIVSCLEDGFSEDDVLNARELVLFGEYQVALTETYWLIASKSDFVSNKTKALLETLGTNVRPDGNVAEAASALGIAIPEHGLGDS